MPERQIPSGAPEPADARLVELTLRGEQTAFAELVRRYERPVYSVVVRIVRDPELANDICQDAFIRAHRFLGKFDPSYRFSSWIFRIAHNVAVDHLRKKRVSTVSLDAATESGSASLGDFLEDEKSDAPSGRVERENLAGALERALAKIRPDYREVLLLRFQLDLSYSEIVDVTGLPLGTVKTYLHRGRREMASLMRAAGWGETTDP
ncbi:MAG: hypothetical protein CME06_12025 [Gemmatimonadetes bacterium]|nr:hypothetical protein [Gemmatimonadota bacterium]